MLNAEKLCKRYGSSTVVENLDLCVEVGQIRGLLGPNGAGKTTTLNMICGVLEPSGGKVMVDGFELAVDPLEVKQRIGYVPDGAPLPPELFPVEYFNAVGRMYGLPKHEIQSSIEKWSKRLDVESVLDQPIETLSRGFRQRVAIVGALLHEPLLLVLDEPSTGLDPEQHLSFRELLKYLSQYIAILYSSHNLAEVEATCDIVTIIADGKCVVDGTFDSIAPSVSKLHIEVSPHAIADSIEYLNSKIIDEQWIQLTIPIQEQEVIASKIEQHGGAIRLIHPLKPSLEETYVTLVTKDEA